jgi:hypothetical protein
MTNANAEQNKSLVDYLDEVHDRDTFIAFVWALIRDREETTERENQAPPEQRGYGAFGWQNDTIDSFLAAALACLDANETRDDYLREPSWQGFAHFLFGGMIYE